MENALWRNLVGNCIDFRRNGEPYCKELPGLFPQRRYPKIWGKSLYRWFATRHEAALQ
jgi:hypothetical protein